MPIGSPEGATRAARTRCLVACATLLAAACPRGDAPPPVTAPELEEGLAGSGAPTMSTKLERTILGIDVLGVTVRFGPTTSRALEEVLAAGAEGRLEDEQLVDSVAAVARLTGNALIQIDLLRDVELGQFLEATRDNLAIASQGGALADQQRETVSSRLDAWFSFLEERGLIEGDRLSYRIRRDTVRTVYEGVDGYRLLDQTDPHAPEVRAAVLAGYLADGVELEEGLAKSLIDGHDR